MIARLIPLLVPVFVMVAANASLLNGQRIPHGQDRLPNPARSPQEAIKKMTVPEGFVVELVASEPDIVNPVAMTFDERGRIWITESVEYPRRRPGKGRDRIKILEDTNGDGRVDKSTIFAEGLNIPSGIAVGHGGVWVANSPDLLLLRDTDGDDRVDETQVIVTGFGRDDTHELPNSLTWGPDGWLYGLNGVFNPSRIQHCGKEHRFTCAMFRINPRPIEKGPWQGKHEFEVFCQGTSNPWGIAFDTEGSAFISACVIDHLWHLTETGYYHRQGGPYPAFTWKIESIVQHRHQKAAYCGLNFFDSDAYPEAYREKLYMGNIHGGCINVDQLTRDGSTYFAKGLPDFLTANDSWFMPVAQKTGPDGCLYVLDWYDRYHCYQDANRDPAGIDRLKGRLYRIRYRNSPRAGKFDLRNESDDRLIERLHDPNIYFRNLAQRLLVERLHAADDRQPLRQKLEQLALSKNAARKPRLHAVWALIGGGRLETGFHLQLLEHGDPGFRAWGIRAAGNQRELPDKIRKRVADLLADPSADVLLQLAIASRKIRGLDPLPTLTTILAVAKPDKLLPRIVWQNLNPYLDERADEFLAYVVSQGLQKKQAVVDLMPRVAERMLASEKLEPASIAKLFQLLIQNDQAEAAGQCLEALSENMQNGQLSQKQIGQLREVLEPSLKSILDSDRKDRLFWNAAIVAVTWNNRTAIRTAMSRLDSDAPDERKVQLLKALIKSEPETALAAFDQVMSESKNHSLNLRRLAVGSMGRLDDSRVANIVLEHFDGMEPRLKALSVELLTERSSWCRALFDAIEKEKIPKATVHLNQIRKLASSRDKEIVRRVEKIWGRIRLDRDPKRAAVISRVRQLMEKEISNVNWSKGQDLYNRKCGICHMFHGKGEKVGPDITQNGRASFDQLLSNVLDPNLVIGADYQARVVITNDGRMITGLLSEENDRRVVLKLQGGKTETIARTDIDEVMVSKVSLMPENLEQDLSDQELVDLMAFVASDPIEGKQPRKWIPGIRPLVPQNINDPKRYHEILDRFAPGFETDRVGELGLGIVADHFGRKLVLRTHPVDRKNACILRKTVQVPKRKKTWLLLSVSHHAGEGPRDWQLVVKANGKVLKDSIIGAKTTVDHWSELRIDLSRFAGQSVKLELHNRANDWLWEFAYWDRIEIESK